MKWQPIRPKYISPSSNVYREICTDDKWIAQEKIDGIRLIVAVNNPIGQTRNSEIKLPHAVMARFAELAADYPFTVFDGELVNAVYYPFDILQAGDIYPGIACWKMPLSQRLRWLSQYCSNCLPLLDKTKAYQEVIARGGEGIVLKHMDDIYEPRARWIKVKPREE